MSIPIGDNYDPNYTPDMQFRPIPPGTYPAKVILADPDLETRWEKVDFVADGERKVYYRAKIKAVISEGEYAGRPVNGKLTTSVNKMGGTKCHDVIIAAKRQELLFDVASHEDLCDAVNAALANEPILNIVVGWQAPLKPADGGDVDWTKAIYKANKFPEDVDKDGNTFRSHVLRTDEGTYVAMAVINGFRA